MPRPTARARTGKTVKPDTHLLKKVIKLLHLSCLDTVGREEKGSQLVREAPMKKKQLKSGHCPEEGGGSRPCPDCFGALFFGHFWVKRGGGKPCPNWFGALFFGKSKNIKFWGC